ncbi:MAG: polysaccharide biosynthesis protein [Tetragenococcus halophilus]|nr:polysaccharide biosynthesis protein [Tetragenococcus halophilus]MDN6310927.1 polysaccharide biosynthesis protein [Psychroflexus sp.]
MTHSNKPEILITGATGTIGFELCRQLAKKYSFSRDVTLAVESQSNQETLERGELIGIYPLLKDNTFWFIAADFK